MVFSTIMILGRLNNKTFPPRAQWRDADGRAYVPFSIEEHETFENTSDGVDVHVERGLLLFHVKVIHGVSRRIGPPEAGETVVLAPTKHLSELEMSERAEKVIALARERAKILVDTSSSSSTAEEYQQKLESAYWHILGGHQRTDEVTAIEYEVIESYFVQDQRSMKSAFGEVYTADGEVVRSSRNCGVVLMQMFNSTWNNVARALGGVEILNHHEVKRLGSTR